MGQHHINYTDSFEPNNFFSDRRSFCCSCPGITVPWAKLYLRWETSGLCCIILCLLPCTKDSCFCLQECSSTRMEAEEMLLHKCLCMYGSKLLLVFKASCVLMLSGEFVLTVKLWSAVTNVRKKKKNLLYRQGMRGKQSQACFIFPRGSFEVLAENCKENKLGLPGDQILLDLMSSGSWSFFFFLNEHLLVSDWKACFIWHSFEIFCSVM